MTRSESPYDRLGQLGENSTQPRQYTLRFGQNPFVIAHEVTGEWRDWRDILVESQVDDPFDLMGVSNPTTSMHYDVSTVDLMGVESVDFSADLGLPVVLSAASPELDGRGVLKVEDIDDETFELSFAAPGSDVFGEPTSVELARFTGVDGQQNLTQGVQVLDASGRYVLCVELNLDVWLVLWMARTMDVLFFPTPTRKVLLIPEVQF